MLIAIAVFGVVCEAIFTALEVALGAVSRARLRALVEAETALESAGAAERNGTSKTTAPKNGASKNGASKNGAPRLSRARVLAERAACLLRLLDQPDRLTFAFIIVTSLSLWVASSLITWQALQDGWPRWVLPLVLVAVLFVAEVLPLLVAARNPEAIALRCVRLVEASLVVLSPLIWLLGGIGMGLARLFGVGPRATPRVTEGELRAALHEAEQEGVIEVEERNMLESAMDLDERAVREVMTPRIDIVGVPEEMPIQDVLETAMREGHARLPVYRSTLDRITGVVAIKDLIPHLRRLQNGEEVLLCARDVARAAFYVPEHKRIASTLEELRRQRTLMAIVVDSDGGTAGLVTLEDLLEEIVGGIQDEYDEEEPSLRVVPAQSTGQSTLDGVAGSETEAAPISEIDTETGGAVVVEGSVSVREVERFWRRHFEEQLCLHNAEGEAADEAISLAALAMQLFDGVPKTGDRVRAGVAVEDDEGNPVREATPDDGDPVDLEIVAMDGPRIEEVRLEKTGLVLSA